MIASLRDWSCATPVSLIGLFYAAGEWEEESGHVNEIHTERKTYWSTKIRIFSVKNTPSVPTGIQAHAIESFSAGPITRLLILQ